MTTTLALQADEFGSHHCITLLHSTVQGCSAMHGCRTRWTALAKGVGCCDTWSLCDTCDARAAFAQMPPGEMRGMPGLPGKM